MYKYIVPTILLGTAAAGFYFFVKPLYEDVVSNRDKISSYNLALENANTLKAEKEKLNSKYYQINPEDLDRLKKMLPDGIDNVRLILEIGELGRPYGMVLKDIKYDSVKKNDVEKPTEANADNTLSKNTGISNYGVWNLEFSTQGSYSNFLAFVKDIENNLRIVDISSVDFSVEAPSSTRQGSLAQMQSDFYKYNLKIKTYWLKN